MAPPGNQGFRTGQPGARPATSESGPISDHRLCPDSARNLCRASCQIKAPEELDPGAMSDGKPMPTPDHVGSMLFLTLLSGFFLVDIADDVGDVVALLVLFGEEGVVLLVIGLDLLVVIDVDLDRARVGRL